MTTTDDTTTDTADATPPADTRPAMTDDEKRLRAARAIVAKVLEDEAKKLVAGERSGLEPNVLPRENVVAELPDGTIIGVVGKSRPAKSGKVTDERALLAWVQKNRPDEIIVTKSVRESYVDALKDQAKNEGWAYDPVTKEVIPGITQVEGTSSYSPRPDADAVRDLVRPRLLNLLATGLMPALPAPNPDTDR